MAFPDFPGVPPLQSSTVAAAVLVAAPALSNLLDLFAQTWGVFNQPADANATAVQVIVPDSFLSLDYVNSSNIPTFPQEQGAFASYNKVKNPRSHTVTMSKGGSKKDMSDFVSVLETLEDSLDLYTIVTPNKSYVNANIDRCEYHRSADSGAGIIIATVHFTEIRQASAVFSQPGTPSATATTPSAQAQTNNGQVYPSIVQNAIGMVQ